MTDHASVIERKTGDGQWQKKANLMTRGIETRELHRRADRRIAVAAKLVIDAHYIGEKNGIEAATLDGTRKIEPRLQTFVVELPLAGGAPPVALAMMVRRDVREGVADQTTGHVSNSAG
jgi:hypothetical protein